MKAYTKEQMNVLNQFENNFYTAINAGYSRNITSDKIKLLEDTTGVKCGNRSCTHCVLTFLRTIGETYFYTLQLPVETEPEDAPKTSMEVIDKIIESDQEIKEQVKEMIKATDNKENGNQTKPKRGRPKKSDTE